MKNYIIEKQKPLRRQLIHKLDLQKRSKIIIDKHIQTQTFNNNGSQLGILIHQYDNILLLIPNFTLHWFLQQYLQQYFLRNGFKLIINN